MQDVKMIYGWSAQSIKNDKKSICFYCTRASLTEHFFFRLLPLKTYIFILLFRRTIIVTLSRGGRIHLWYMPTSSSATPSSWCWTVTRAGSASCPRVAGWAWLIAGSRPGSCIPPWAECGATVRSPCATTVASVTAVSSVCLNFAERKFGRPVQISLRCQFPGRSRITCRVIELICQNLNQVQYIRHSYS